MVDDACENVRRSREKRHRTLPKLAALRSTTGNRSSLGCAARVDIRGVAGVGCRRGGRRIAHARDRFAPSALDAIGCNAVSAIGRSRAARTALLEKRKNRRRAKIAPGAVHPILLATAAPGDRFPFGAGAGDDT